MPMSKTIADRDLEALLAQARDPDATLDRKLLCDALEELHVRRDELGAEEQLQRHQGRLLELARSKAVGNGELQEALDQITETAAEILSVARASVWRYTEDGSQIECMSLYRADTKAHESGLKLSRSDFPIYFEALVSERVLVADDAHTHGATAEFSEVYLTPLGIGAMLDAPIRVGGRMIGVICNEHVGPERPWTSVEVQLATSLADFIALAMETAERVRTEEELRASIALAQEHLDTIESQRVALADVSAPIIDVWEGIIVLPIVGLVDAQRSLLLTEHLLQRISVSGARSVIVDLTGVDVVDTMTANHLLQMLSAAGLLGSFCMLSGISPQIAQTLVELEVDLGDLTAVRSLKEGLKICIARQGR